MLGFRQTFFFTGLLLAAGLPVSASAQCPVPHVISNGEVADATEVMENFNAVAQCAEDAADNSVTQTGTPQTGEVAVFSGDKVVTGGNLTGDVTTSGGTETTLADTGVVAGTYVSPNVTIDTKGRITEATNGTGGGGGGAGLVSARVIMSGTQSLPSNASARVRFDSVEFSGAAGLWTNAPDHQFVVPVGFNRAELVGSTGATSADHSSHFEAVLLKNGIFVGLMTVASDHYGRIVVSSGVISVAPGDQIWMNARSRYSKTLGDRSWAKPFLSIKLWNE